MTRIDALIREAASAVDRIESVGRRLAAELAEVIDPALLSELDGIEADLRAAWTDAEADLGRCDAEPSVEGAVVAAVLAATDIEALAYLEEGEAAAFPAGPGGEWLVTVERPRALGGKRNRSEHKAMLRAVLHFFDEVLDPNDPDGWCAFDICREMQPRRAALAGHLGLSDRKEAGR